jgi:hypothetical protein
MRGLTLSFVFLLGAACLVAACGGDDGDQRRTTPDWQPSERLPVVAQHWWGDPVERFCEETTECRRGERCRPVRLSSCREGCPEGETARVCVPDDWEGEQALRYPTPRPDDGRDERE